MKTLINSSSMITSKTVTNNTMGVNSFLRKTFTCPTGTTLDIRHLYDNTYRLNYWGKHTLHLGKGETNGILYSIWVVVKPTKNGFEVIERSDN